MAYDEAMLGRMRFAAPRAPWVLGALLGALALAGCDGDGGDDAGADAGAMDAGEAPMDAGEPGCDAGADPFSCEDLTPDPSCPASWVVGLTGTVVDEAGAPVQGAFTQACLRLHPDDSLVCLSPPPGGTAADGSFAIVIPESLRCINRAVMRVIAPTLPFATTYCPIVFGPDVTPIFDVADPYVMRPVAPATVPARGDETMARDVTFPDGVVLTLAPRAIPMSGDYDELAGGTVDASATACFAGGETFDGAYVFSPESPVTGGARVSLPNADGLSPGAQVDLFLLGGLETYLLDGTMIEEAELGSVGTATVSADGTVIETDPGSELPYLSWLVWKAR